MVFAYRLLDGFTKIKAYNNIILLVSNDNYISVKDRFPYITIITININNNLIYKKLPFLKGYLFKSALNKIIINNNITILFSPYLSLGSFITSIIPHVGVLHDAQSYILTKSEGLKGYLFRFLMVRIYCNITHMVTISKYARSSIKKEIPSIQSPISVIYNSVIVDKIDSEFHLRHLSPYILYINTLVPYKNLETLIRAFVIIKDDINHNLIVKAIKLPYWDSVIEPLLLLNDIKHRVILIEENFSNQQLSSLYSDADLFVSPSIMEGFGFTPIEAAIHKIPVISSKASALYETTLGILNYYEPPDDYITLAKNIKNLLRNRPSLERMSEISYLFKDVYSPIKQAKSFLELFKKIDHK